MNQPGKQRSHFPHSAEGWELDSPPPERVPESELESLLPELLKQYEEAFGIEGSLGAYPVRRSQLSPTTPSSVVTRRESDIWNSSIRDLAFELLLHRVAQQQGAFRTERSASLDSAKEPEPAPAIPSTLMLARTPESPHVESESFDKVHDVILPFLPVLAIGLAIILGVLIGMHIARNRATARVLSQDGPVRPLTTGAAVQMKGPSTNAGVAESNSSPLAARSNHVGSHDVHRKASKHAQIPGGLTVYENEKVIFRLHPHQGGMP